MAKSHKVTVVMKDGTKDEFPSVDDSGVDEAGLLYVQVGGTNTQYPVENVAKIVTVEI